MAWLKTLAETYDVYGHLAGVDKNEQAVLLPVSHSTFNAQIEVILDLEGNIQDSKKLEKGDDVVTIIPVTKDSATKTSGITPHPLCDKLCYIAGDYSLYTGDDKEKYFEAYMKQLEDWAESEYTHPFVQAIYKYLSKKTLIRDLAAKGTLELDSVGKLTDDIKIQGLGQTGANVRFRILGCDGLGKVWKNQELFKRYSSYYQQKLVDKELCYVSGKVESCSDKHPSKIRNSSDKAKLISGNDTSGFTYRGRFVTKEQAVSVGYNTSQKAHNALRWLIQKQGYTRDESAIVCWMANRDMQVPDFTKDSVNAFGDIDDFDFDFDSLDMDAVSNISTHDTGKYFAEQFNHAVNGYAGKMKLDDKVVIIALESAMTGKGRLSIAYYDEMGGKQYIDAILNWQNHCKWRRTIKAGKKGEEKRKITCECTPSPRDMALAAFGAQKSDGHQQMDSKGNMSLAGSSIQKPKQLEADPKLLRATVKRLLPCITQRSAKIPEDIIRAAAGHVSMPQTISDSVWYNDVLCVTCAMIRFNYEKGVKKMDNFLKENINDRNVLFGRLLAVYDFMEQCAMFERDENGKVKEQRMTNAKRYWNAYSRRPARTAKTIEENLNAYEKKLNGYQRKKFEEWIEEIMGHMTIKEYDNRALSEMYIPAYYQQMEYMKNELWKENSKGEISNECIYKQD